MFAMNLDKPDNFVQVFYIYLLNVKIQIKY